MKKNSPPNALSLPWQQPLCTPLLRWFVVSLFALIAPALYAAAPTVIEPTSASLTFESVTLGGNVSADGGSAVTARGVVYSATADDATPTIGEEGPNVLVWETSGTTGVFTIPITDLEYDTEYSFSAFATNADGTTHTAPVATFTTPHATATVTAVHSPAADIATSTHASTTVSSATLQGTVTSPGAQTIIRGFVYARSSVNGNPLIDGTGVTNTNPPGLEQVVSEGLPNVQFSAGVTDLLPFTQYVYKAYIINDAGTSYSTTRTFITPAVVPPIITPAATAPVLAGTAVPSYTATLSADVTHTGGRTITERGFVYSFVDETPEIGEADVTKVNATGSTGVVTKAITGLKPGKTYFFRAFARNGAGIVAGVGTGVGYSAVGTFVTPAVAPTLASPTIASLAATSVILGGTVSADGGGTISARGVVYSVTATNANPFITDAPATATIVAATGDLGTGLFKTASITGLAPGTQYSFKPYATNGVNTAYGAVTTFTTRAGAPTVTTPTSDVDAVTDVVTLGGNVTTTGGATITERGVVYSRTSVNRNPRIGVSGVKKVAHATDVTGVFTVTAPSSGLEGGKEYTYRAYATNSKGTTYTAVTVDTVFTAPATAPLVNRPTSSLIGATKARLGGRVVRTNGAPIILRGVVYSTSDSTPTIDEGATSVNHGTAATGAFRVSVTGLTPDTEYHFAAFAENEEGVSYSAPSSFTTKTSRPVLTTTAADPVTSTTARIGGNVTSDGGPDVLERGVVYSIKSVNSNPKIGGRGVTASASGGTTGSFTRTLTGLKASTRYSFRAYARNSKGTAYGTVLEFVTPAAP